MLESITVKDLALIRHAQIELGEGLNILSGETGAGKSILIGSVNYCLGAKADKSMIREGADHALMELVFRVENEETIEAVRAMELPVEEDGRVIISRRITAKSSSIRVCGESVSAAQVRELASLLIDVHGQHEHQSLLHAARHLELLDAGLPDTAKKELESIKELYAAFRELRVKQERLMLDEGKRERELSLAEYEIGEIEAAHLKPGEEAELEERYRRMKKGRDAFENLHRVQELLMEDGGGALEGLGRAVHELRSAASGDDTLTDCAGMLSDAESMIRDCLREVDDYMESSLFDPQYFDETEKRLDELRRLIARYGQDEESVLAYLEQRKKEAEELRDLDSTREKLEKQLKETKEKLDKCCDSLHKKRVKAAETLQKEVMDVLTDLNFLKADFQVKLSEKEEAGPKGRDEAEFMISLNPGEKLRPLKDVASGGELSRIMLALKSVFAARDSIETMIFDEIDAGISGKTAWKVAEKMGALSKKHQLICITHLPQIAAMADTHFLIEKEAAEGRTETEIKELAKEDQLMELARMLGGDHITDAVLANARQLKKDAGKPVG